MSRLTVVPVLIARWSATHPWRAIGAWFAFVALAVGLATLIPTKQTTDADYWIGESGRAQSMLDRGGIDSPPTELVLITSRSGPLEKNEVGSAATELTDRMSRAPGVASVAPLAWSPDGSAALVTVILDKDTHDAEPLVAATEAIAGAHPGLRLEQAGDLTIDEGIFERVEKDLRTAEVISLPMTLLLMLLAFGALIAAGVPVLLAGTSVAATLGLAAPISHLVPAEPTVNSVIVLIGMAVGVDYSLFYLKREREERAKGAHTLDAVEIAAATSGHAILVSGGAVIAAMAGLYAVGAATFASLATGAIVVVAVAVLGSITVLPALLVKLGRFVDRPRIPLLWRMNARIGRGGISGRLLNPVIRHPKIALGVSLAAMAVLAVPAFGMDLHNANLKTLPADIPQVATFNRIVTAFPSQGTTAVVVVRAEADRQAKIAAGLRELSDRAVATPSFTDLGQDPIGVSDDRTTTRLTLAIPFEDSDPRAEYAVNLLRDSLAPSALDGAGAEYAVGGGAAESLDFANRMSQRMPWVIGFVLGLTGLMMFSAFRSWRLAGVSVALNLLSIGVAFGVLRWVFQDGHLESFLDFTSPGFLIEWVPLFMLAILVGLSMDYHVFVLSRVQEYAASGLSPREAVRRGIADTAGVVTSAAAVMVSVFTIFATLSMLEMKMMGVGLAVAILVDATIIRLVMLPAVLVLLGERAWARRRPDPAVTAAQVAGAEREPALAGMPR